jgi:hypothetical protein
MFELNEVDKRLLKKISLNELAVIVFVLIVALYFLLTKSGSYFDYKIFLATAQGDFDNYYYGYWLLPIFKILSYLPFEFGYLMWIILSLIGVIFAARVFSGSVIVALLSYQMSYALFWGQISGIICGLLGLFWWAIHRRRWGLAGIAFLLVAAKPQSGGMFVLLLWIFSEIKWKHKFQVLIIPFVGFILSLVFYPGWIFDVISRIDGVVTWGNVSLWQWIGPFALLLFVPLLIVPMTRQKRFVASVSACILTIPYFLQTDLLTLFIFPIGIIPIILGYLPAIMPFYIGYEGQHIGFLVPLFIYLSILIPEFFRRINSNKRQTQS